MVYLIQNMHKQIGNSSMKSMKKKANKKQSSDILQCLTLGLLLLKLFCIYINNPVDTRRRFNDYKTSIRRRRRRIDVL